MNKEQIKKILENHMEILSKISNKDDLLIENPILMYMLTESLKTTAMTLFFIDRI